MSNLRIEQSVPENEAVQLQVGGSEAAHDKKKQIINENST